MSKKKKRTSFTRQQGEVERHDRVLVVCEDSKSSPNYFDDLVKYERLSAVDIEITGDCGSDPVSVVNEAIDLYTRSVEDNNPASTFDQVYCVIDRDDHKNFDQAVNKINDHVKNGKPLNMVRSYPCFEFWYLCHFTNTRANIGKIGSKSSANQCISLLNKQWKAVFRKKYDKSQTGIYRLLHDRLPTAMSHSKGIFEDAKTTGDMNPSTEVHKLVHDLIHIREK